MLRTLICALLAPCLVLLGCGSDATAPDLGVTTDAAVDLALVPPTQLAPAQTLTNCLAVDATNVYWADQIGIVEVPVGGGARNAIVPGPHPRGCTVVSSGFVYYSESGAGDASGFDTVYRVATSFGSPSALAGGQHVLGRLAVDGSYVYWLTDVYGPADAMFSGKDALVRMPLAGGNIDVLYSDIAPPVNEALFVDDTNVYYSDGSGVVARKKDGSGMPLVFGMGTLHGTPFVTDGINLAMVEATGIMQGNLVLYRVDGNGRTVLSPAVETPLAIDGTGVYTDEAGQLVRLSLDGKTTTSLATASPRAVALDASNIYFTDGAAILKLTR